MGASRGLGPGRGELRGPLLTGPRVPPAGRPCSTFSFRPRVLCPPPRGFPVARGGQTHLWAPRAVTLRTDLMLLLAFFQKCLYLERAASLAPKQDPHMAVISTLARVRPQTSGHEGAASPWDSRCLVLGPLCCPDRNLTDQRMDSHMQRNHQHSVLV